jgi:hypothetical protein
MQSIFLFQLTLSVTIGGAFVAVLSFIAESANKKIAGPVLALPSTAAIGLFFIGWTVSPQAVADIAPATILALGTIPLFTASYLYLSRIKLKKWQSIFLSTTGALLVWFGLSIPLALFKFSSLFWALAGYLILTFIAYYLITVRVRVSSRQIVANYSAQEKLVRAVLGGFIIGLAIYLANVLNPFWGGIFAAFPALFVSTLTILHRHHDSSFLFRTFHNSPLGILVSLIYILAVMFTYPAYGIIWGTLLAYLTPLALLLIFHLINKESF